MVKNFPRSSYAIGLVVDKFVKQSVLIPEDQNSMIEQWKHVTRFFRYFLVTLIRWSITLQCLQVCYVWLDYRSLTMYQCRPATISFKGIGWDLIWGFICQLGLKMPAEKLHTLQSLVTAALLKTTTENKFIYKIGQSKWVPVKVYLCGFDKNGHTMIPWMRPLHFGPSMCT